MADSNFIDYVKIFCASGHGGAGSTHLYRAKYVPKGGPCYRMKDCCLAVDGQGEDPNRFDVWVSARFEGPAFRPGEKGPNAQYIGRVILVVPDGILNERNKF